MTAVKLTETRRRTTALDRDLETARREVSQIEREEAEQETRERVEYRQWIRRTEEKFRPALNLYLSVYPLIKDLDDAWRTGVFRGTENFDQDTERAVRSLFGLWAAYSDMFAEKGAFLIRHGCNFAADLDRISSHKREALETLRSWEPPVVSLIPSLRETRLSPEGVAKVRDLLPGIL